MNCKIFTIKSQTCRKRGDVTKFVKPRKTNVAGKRKRKGTKRKEKQKILKKNEKKKETIKRK